MELLNPSSVTALAAASPLGTAAAGIAGTTSGQSFSILSSDLQDVIIYTNAAGTATELFRIKTKAFIDACGLDPSSYSSRTGYVFAWLDSTDKMALGIRDDGKVIFGNGGDIAADISTLNAFSDTINTFIVSDNNYSRSGYAFAWLDSTGQMALGIRNDGKVIFGNGGDIEDAISAANAAVNALNAIVESNSDYDRSGYVWSWQDSAGNVAGGIDPAGNIISKGLNLTNVGEQTATNIAANTAAITAIQTRVTPAGFWWYGDSLSQSGVGPLLAGYLGKTVTVGGVGGLTGNAVSVRYGGEVSFFTLSGNTIPASGAVDVTVRTVDPINIQNITSLTGKLAGIHGSFSSDGATYWRFTRTTAGTAKVIDPATPFIIDVLDQRHYGTNIFWYGRNNVGTPTFNADVKRAIADSIAQIQTVDKRFVVLSVLNWPGETTGTAKWTEVETLNSELKTLYPRNFVDVLNLLRRSGDGSANDIADAASGIIPRSLRNSSVDGHLNDTTGNPIVANRVFEFLTEKGWV